MKNGKKVADVRLADIMEAIRQEDVLSIELIAGIGEKIGRGLAVLINIFNPELVILGGTMAETGDYIRLPIRSALNKYSLSLVNNDTQVKAFKARRKGRFDGRMFDRAQQFAHGDEQSAGLINKQDAQLLASLQVSGDSKIMAT